MNNQEYVWRGLAKAIVHDGKVDDEEIALLGEWLRNHDGRKNGPLAKIKKQIEEICRTGNITTQERNELLNNLKAYSEKTTGAEKGDSFEIYVISCFDRKEYKLIEWRSDKYIPGWGGPLSACWPDLVIEHIQTGKRIAIECKYRFRPKQNSIEWARPEQFTHYKEYEEKEGITVYIAIGLGENPKSPQYLYIIPLKELKGGEIEMNELDQYLVRNGLIELEA